MTAIGQNFEIYSGEVKKLRLSIVNDNNQPQDLTGVSLVWVLYNRTTKQILVTKTLGAGITLEGSAVSGIAIVALDPADTANIEPQQLNHECELTDAIGPSIVCTGMVKVLDSVIN